MKNFFLALTVFSLLTLQSLSGIQRAVAASFPPTVHTHAVPCPAGLVPDRLRVSWSVNRSGPEPGPMTGRRTLHGSATVRQLYSAICRLTLVSFTHPVKTACGVARPSNSGIYHLAFLRKTQKLLRVTERINGCASLSVDGRFDLGAASLSQGLILPADVPR